MFGSSDGNVIEMGDFFNAPKYRALREVEAYWDGLRHDGQVPKRSDVDPRGIENALEYAFILEKIAPGLARLRIAGMHLCDLMGMEVRGMPISSFIPPAGRAAFAEILDAVTSRPAAARITLQAEESIGRPPLSGQMILLPMMSDFGDVTRVLGAFETDGKIGRGPRRFNVVQSELRSLDTPHPALDNPAGTESAEELRARLQRRLDEHAGTTAEEPIGRGGLSEAPRAFTGKNAGQKNAGQETEQKTDQTAAQPARPPYLRLVKSDD